MIAKYSPKFFPILIFGFLASVFCFSHYKEGFLVLRGDTGYPLNPEIYLKSHISAWFNTYWTGQAAGHSLGFAFPLLVIIFLLNKIFDPSQSQIILLTGLFFTSGYFSYLFFALANPENKKSNILGGLFYMLNIPIIAEWYVPNPWFFIAYASLPVTAIGCYYLVKNYWYGIFWIAVGYLFVASGFTNTPLLGITMLSNILVVVYFGIKGRLRITRQLFLIASLFITFVLANLWWLSLLFEYRQEGEAIIKTMDITRWAVDSSRNANLLTLLTNCFTPVLDGKSIPYSKLVNGSFAYLLYGFFPVVFLSYLFQKNREVHILYLLAMYFVIMFLVKGTQAPLGSVYIFMLKYIPYFSIFKTPAEKFGVLFLFWQAFLVSAVFRKNSHIITGGLILLAFAYPVYTGNLFSKVTLRDGYVLEAYQKVHPSYREVAKLINEDKYDGRVLLLPLAPNYQVTYTSSSYRGLPWLKSMIEKPLIGHWNIKRDNVFLFLRNLHDEPAFSGWARKYNINWIVLNRDLVPGAGNPPEGVRGIELMLEDGKGYQRVGDFGDLVLFKARVKKKASKISSKGVIPHIYPPAKIAIVE